jgi:vacuolar-type H+-ATPase subunit C/Vma6
VTALWYVILKESEVRSLRLTLKAVFDNIPLEEIRKLVVFAA